MVGILSRFLLGFGLFSGAFAVSFRGGHVLRFREKTRIHSQLLFGWEFEGPQFFRVIEGSGFNWVKKKNMDLQVVLAERND